MMSTSPAAFPPLLTPRRPRAEDEQLLHLVQDGLSVVTPTLDAWVLRAIVQTTRPLSGRQVAPRVSQLLNA